MDPIKRQKMVIRALASLEGRGLFTKKRIRKSENNFKYHRVIAENYLNLSPANYTQVISLLKNKPEGELGGLWFVGKHSKIERTAEQEQQLLALIDEFANDIESEEAFWKGVLSKEFLNPLRASEDNLEAMSDEEMEKLLGDEDSVIVFNAPQVSQEPEQVDFDLTNRSKLKEALQVFSIEDRKLIRERKIALSEKYFRNYRNGQIEDIFDIFQINGIKVKISSNSNIGENGIWPSELVS